MLRKKLLLLLMLVTLLASLSATGGARACSGDNCDCGIYAAECRESCYELPAGTARFACVQQCNRESIACAKACCDPYSYDPDPYHNY